jgi:hypothetical protein
MFATNEVDVSQGTTRAKPLRSQPQQTPGSTKCVHVPSARALSHTLHTERTALIQAVKNDEQNRQDRHSPSLSTQPQWRPPARRLPGRRRFEITWVAAMSSNIKVTVVAEHSIDWTCCGAKWGVGRQGSRCDFRFG